MGKIPRFMRELYSHWAAAWLGTMSLVVAVVLWIMGRKELTWGGFAFFAFVCFFIACFQVWREQEEQLTKLRVVPKLFLRHRDPKRNEFFKDLAEEVSSFFLQVEGPNKAFKPQIVSPDTIGRDHTRLEMVWGSVNVPVGNDPVPVAALCSMKKGTASSSQVGSQIEAYMRMKAEEPKELIAVISYTDVDGNNCPPRKFRIYRERDITGDLKTHCDLVND